MLLPYGRSFASRFAKPSLVARESGSMLASMKWPGFLFRRPAESKNAQEARDSELEEQNAAEAAKPQSEQPPTSEPVEPSTSEPPEPSG